MVLEFLRAAQYFTVTRLGKLWELQTLSRLSISVFLSFMY